MHASGIKLSGGAVTSWMGISWLAIWRLAIAPLAALTLAISVFASPVRGAARGRDTGGR